MDYSSTVDRSYHQNKIIRDYQDRGMVKWQGFYLSEHTTTMREAEELEALPIIEGNLTLNDKLFLLSQSYSLQSPLRVTVKNAKKYVEEEGVVSDFVGVEEVVLKNAKKYVRLSLKNIVKITSKEDKNNDEMEI